MRLFKRIILLFIVLLLSYIGYVLVSTGYFRSIEPKFEGKILKKIALKGAEDITISIQDSFAIISATDRHWHSSEEIDSGHLYWMDLKTGDFELINLTSDFDQPFAPHGIALFKKDSTYQVMAISHISNTHTIEVFELKGKTLTHIETMQHPSMISPNDLVMIDEKRFYFTNDHGYTAGMGKFLEEYGGLAVSNVVYFDGNQYTEVADGIAYANGINYDSKRNLLFVASPRAFMVKAYSTNKDGSLSFIENIPCGTGVDNIEFDENGRVWIGSHPNLLRFAAYAKRKKKTAPSEIITITYQAKGDYNVEKVYVEEGNEMSASTVAAPIGNLILTGSVFDEVFLILERNSRAKEI